MSPEITSNDPRVLILHVQRNISSFNLSTGTNILVFCTERQTRKIHVLDATHSRPQSHSTTWPRNDGLWGREWTRRADVLTLANTRTTAWACATFLLFEYLLPVASYSRRVSDLKVPIFLLLATLNTYRYSFGPCYPTKAPRWNESIFPGLSGALRRRSGLRMIFQNDS